MPRPVGGLHHPPRDPWVFGLGGTPTVQGQVFLGRLAAMARRAPLSWGHEPGGTLENCAVQKQLSWGEADNPPTCSLLPLHALPL